MAPLLALTLAASRILLPPWPLSPDGDHVAVKGADELEADGADVMCVAPGLWRVDPEGQAPAVELRAGEARAKVAVEEPMGAVAITARPAAALKGKDERIALELEVRSPSGALDEGAAAPVVRASTGRVRDVTAAGPGRFTAVYEPEKTRQPEVVVLVALSPRCPTCPTPRAVGAGLLPLSAAIDLPGETEPRASTTVYIGGKRFGPAKADRRGRFSLPVVVPPGVRVAKAVTRDRAGNRSVTRVSLGVRSAERLACLAWPETVRADGESEAGLWCAAVDRAGHAATPRLSVRSSAGRTGQGKAAGAIAHVPFRAPRGGAEKPAAISLRDAAGGAAEVLVGLAAGAPDRVVVVLGRDPVPVGSTVPARAEVLDAHGDHLGRAAAPPGARLGFVAPDRFVARPTRGDGRQYAPLAFALRPGTDVATLTLARQGRRWVAVARTIDARPAVGVRLRFGSGAEVVTDARGEARTRARGSRETVEAPNGARAVGWKGIVPPESPFEILRALDVRLSTRNDALVQAPR
jgi:hypothetical protein